MQLKKSPISAIHCDPQKILLNAISNLENMKLLKKKMKYTIFIEAESYCLKEKCG